MSDTTTPLPSLADRVRPIAAGGGIVGVHFLGRTPVFVLGEEVLLFAPDDGEQRQDAEQPVCVDGSGLQRVDDARSPEGTERDSGSGERTRCVLDAQQ